ncbi:MAG: deoxyguanosinetriphosphate triphosphohydrolase [Oscillospiraceae bacterium]
MTVREQYEDLEYHILSPMARLSRDAVRDTPMEECPIRTAFRRDCDRILHCKSFRRLKHKTQVFLSPEGDHYRTRLTHTLEVAQIARTVARALRLNEDLTEAIALGHDLGHTPYGHAGEAALSECCPHGYRHAAQSVRVVERIENDGRGLNLTREVRDGIACHSSGQDAMTLEGRIVRYADKIAYMNHDIEDAIRAGLLAEDDIPWEVRYTVGRSKSERIDAFVKSLVANSADDIRMASDVRRSFDILQEFLFEAVYKNSIAKGEEHKARELLKTLYYYFVAHPNGLPEEYAAIARDEDIDRAVCDYISGMTDRYAVRAYDNLFIPRSWGM